MSTPDIAAAIAAATERIAPAWPLDRLIAVNPHWGWIHRPVEDAGAALTVLGGARLLEGRTARRIPLVADRLGARAAVVHQIGQHCAAYFDAGQASWHAPMEQGLFAGWRERVRADRGITWPGGRSSALCALAALPADPQAAIEAALTQLGVPSAAWTACATAWLLDVNGWAAACAYKRWQARLAGGDDAHIVELLAIRAAWDLLLAAGVERSVLATFAHEWASVPEAIAAERERQAPDWARLAGAERALQASIVRILARPPARPTAPRAQAVFCIDVRSELMRRALEAANPEVATLGFAGFFGVPADHRPLGSTIQQPQLPGLLAPRVTIEEVIDDASLVERRRARLRADVGWDRWRSTPASGFGFVEACGVVYAAQLARASCPSSAPPQTWQTSRIEPAERGRVRPRLAVSAEEAAQIAEGALRGMGLVGYLAPLVLFCGHGGQSANNPHAASLDCGACCGQTGEVNARALAGVLNDPAVRELLSARGVTVPPSTHFLAGLHNTTTDDVTLFDLETVPLALRSHVAELERDLARASAAVRAERAPSLGLPQLEPEALARALRERANDWAETRPEWALAGNAAFIAASRARTRGANLGGRAFLHEYDHRSDPSRAILTQILTAPVVVAHWINFQYLASSVDPERFGAGNKLLHNVVGAGLGVFEGNGGDLRIGLPWQSVHDGERLRHEPLRLSVFIDAPRASIDAVLAEQGTVRDLVDHGWLHLLALEGDSVPTCYRRCYGGGWERADN